MKKLLFMGLMALAMFATSSCSSVYHTSTTIPVQTDIVSVSNAELQVSQHKIAYTYTPSRAVRRAGDARVIESAVSRALRENGNADVLVGFQYEMKKTKNLFGKTKIKYVIVEGYPATYVNIQPAKCTNE